MSFFQLQPFIDKMTRDLIWKISKEEYKPGEQLPSIDEMAKQYGVGRSTIREALKHIQSLGLVHSQHGKGTFIVDIDSPLGGIGILLEAVEFRRMIEVYSIKRAVENRTESDLKTLSELHYEMEKSIESHNRFMEVDRQFHFAIATASKNPFIPHVFLSISGIFRGLQDVIVTLPGSPQKAQKEHKLMLEAIKERDAKLAVDIMNQHMDSISMQIRERHI